MPQYQPEDWILYIGSRKRSLKCDLLHNGNQFAYAPLSETSDETTYSHIWDGFLKIWDQRATRKGERFHQDMKEMETTYQGHWDVVMMADYCWTLMRDIPIAEYSRSSKKR